MDIGSSFSYPMEDENWLAKILIGSVIGLIPIVGGFLQMGFALEAVKRTAEGTSTPLPEWDDWGDKLVKGLMYWVISFVYALPIILVVGCVGLGRVALTSAVIEDSDTLGIVTMLVLTCVGCLVLIYAIVMGLVLPAAVARYAASGELGAAFRFGEVLSMVRNNIGTYAIVLVMTFVVGLVAALGLVACGIGVLVTGFYAQLIVAYLYGSAYKVAMQGSVLVGELATQGGVIPENWELALDWRPPTAVFSAGMKVMDFGKSISYALQDSNWPTKLGIGSLINIVPISNFNTTG